LRFEFPDAWYDLFNRPAATPIETSFSITDADFPPNLLDLRMTNVVLQVRFRDTVTPLDITSLRFVATAGAALDGGAVRLDSTGVVSTRRANGSNWLAIVNGAAAIVPAGTWRLRFADTAQPQFSGDAIDDILFAITFEATLPPWP